MNPTTRPIEPEELMACLDGEIEPERKSLLTTHVNQCAECQKLVDEMRRVSQSLKSWSVAAPQEAIPRAIEGVLIEFQRKQVEQAKIRSSSWRELIRRANPNLAWVAGFAAVLVVVIGTVRFIGGNANSVYSTVQVASSESHSVKATREQYGAVGPETSPPQSRQFDGLEQFAELNAPPPPTQFSGSQQKTSSAPTALPSSAPMIIRTAQLSLITKDFEKARDSVESILHRRRGYLADLKVGGSAGSGRSLTGTLRVPADQLEATLTELKSVGRVEAESQSGEDVTSQYVDLEARLTNARNTERRLTDLLRNRTGKLSDVLEVEQEISRVRGEIEQMEAERKTMANQVSFATINLTVSEDYKAQLQVVPPSTSTRLRNAAVEGYRNVVDGILSFALFLLSSGPTLLIWAAILFIPARFAWRKLRPGMTQ